jgi:hypothetical protein
VRIVGHHVEDHVRIDESQSVVTAQQSHDLVGARAGSCNAYHTVERVWDRFWALALRQDDLSVAVDRELDLSARADAQSITDRFGNGDLTLDGDGVHDPA